MNFIIKSFNINFKQYISCCVQNTYFDSSIKTASSTDAAYCRFFCKVSAGISPHCSCRKRLRNLINQLREVK